MAFSAQLGRDCGRATVARPNLSVTNCQPIVAHPAHPRAERGRSRACCPFRLLSRAQLHTPFYSARRFAHGSRRTPSSSPAPSPHAGEESRRAWKLLRGAASRARSGEYPLPRVSLSPLRFPAALARARIPLVPLAAVKRRARSFGFATCVS